LFVNLSELRTALQERREDYSQSDAKLGRKINQSYQGICSRRRWSWLRRRHTQTTYAPIKSSALVGFSVAGTENGKRAISVSGTETPTSLGKLIKIDGDFYRVESINAAHTSWTLDRPLRCTASGTHYIDVFYNEVALPVGTLSVVESMLFKGGSAAGGSPLSMGALSPEEMSRLNMDVEGSPSRFSTVRKEPIPAPRQAPTLAPSSGSSLALGTYTYWFTYVDKQTGAESALGPPSTVALITVTMSNVTIGANDARTDLLLRLYRSTVDGSAPLLLLDPQVTGFVSHIDTVIDEYLSIPGPSSSSTLFMQLYPVPDAEYEVHSLIQIEPTPLSEDNDYPLFDSQFHQIILDGAEALMLEASDEHGRANQARQRYEMGIARMIQMDRLNMQQSVVFGGKRRVRGAATWWYGALSP
jgi:hypothetical protein